MLHPNCYSVVGKHLKHPTSCPVRNNQLQGNLHRNKLKLKGDGEMTGICGTSVHAMRLNSENYIRFPYTSRCFNFNSNLIYSVRVYEYHHLHHLHYHQCLLHPSLNLLLEILSISTLSQFLFHEKSVPKPFARMKPCDSVHFRPRPRLFSKARTLALAVSSSRKCKLGMAEAICDKTASHWAILKSKSNGSIKSVKEWP